MASSFPTARLTIGQMRRSAGRLSAAGIAIAISTAFVSVTLLAGSVIEEMTYNMVAAGYADSDVIVSAPEPSGEETFDESAQAGFTDGDIEAVADVDGVAAVQSVTSWWGNLRNGGEGGLQKFVPVPSDSRLSPLELNDGAWPAADGEVALMSQVADRLGVGIGDTLKLSRTVYPEGWSESQTEGTPEEPGKAVEQLTVTGLADDPYGAYTGGGGVAAVPTATLDAWNANDPAATVRGLLVALDTPPTGDSVPADLETAIQDALAATPGSGTPVDIKTTDAVAAAETAEMTGGENIIFLVFVMAFAAIALLIAAMVIANTFQVLVAQRTRMLALLRCIGAGTSQVYRSVLLEAAILGLIASVIGTAAGALLVQAALMVAPNFDLGVPLPSAIALTPQSILLPLAVGIGVTVLAALSPARSATRVAPLAALRPSDAPTLKARTGRVRLVLSILSIVGGVALLGLGAFLGNSGNVEMALVAAVGGVALTFFGVVLSAVLWLPRVAAGLGALAGRTGPASRLAVANTLRNPRRTAATSTALLIGVTLVTMMSTGAASARATSETNIDNRYPYDVSVSTAAPELVGGLRDAVAGTSGISDTAVVTYATGTIAGGEETDLLAVDPDDLAAAVNVPDEAARLTEGSILLTEDTAKVLALEEGDTTAVAGAKGSVDLTVAITASSAFDQLITSADLPRIADADPYTDIWGNVSDADPSAALVDVQDAAAEVDLDAMTFGPAAQAAQFRQMVDVVLGIMVGLLAVAVIISLVGVTNTLSLAVIERNRESATLRAIGLSTRQLRGMLAVEGALIAAVGVLVGIVLGLVFGWSGSAAALSQMGTVQYAVPWADLAVVVVVALGAGLLASVVPARAAVRTSPVAALGAE